MTETPNIRTVTPIYDAMLRRAENFVRSGANLDAADILTTAAETMRRFDHPSATRVAGWARHLLEEIPEVLESRH